jgi:hypothetical protein
MDVIFHKTGAEIKQAIQERVGELQMRLQYRSQALDEFMQDTGKLRSYLIRSTQRNYGHGGGGRYGLVGKDDISSEEIEEIDQLCRRIYEIEQEMRRLALVAAHIEEAKVFQLNYELLLSYGFKAEI